MPFSRTCNATARIAGVVTLTLDATIISSSTPSPLHAQMCQMCSLFPLLNQTPVRVPSRIRGMDITTQQRTHIDFNLDVDPQIIITHKTNSCTLDDNKRLVRTVQQSQPQSHQPSTSLYACVYFKQSRFVMLLDKFRSVIQQARCSFVQPCCTRSYSVTLFSVLRSVIIYVPSFA